MNKVIMMGRLVKEPEIFNGNSTVAKYSIAVDRKFKRDNDPTADFFNCVSFGKQAEFVQNYLHKGTKIVVAGRIENDSYTSKDGVKKTNTQIIVEDVEFAESKSADAPKEKTNDFLSVPEGLIEELPFN